MPDDTRISNKLKDFIRLLLVPDPMKRPNIKQVMQILESWSTIPSIKLSVRIHN